MRIADDNFSWEAADTWEYVPNECVQMNGGIGRLDHTHVVPNSITGTVYVDGQPVQVFVHLDGQFAFERIGNPTHEAIGGGFVEEDGVIALDFGEDMSQFGCCLNVSYERETQPYRVDFRNDAEVYGHGF